MKKQIDKENVHWTPSSNARRARAPKRPKRKFALVAVPSTLLVCALAAGLALVGMQQNEGDGLAEAAQTVTTAMAQADSSADKTVAADQEVASPRLKDEKGAMPSAQADAALQPLSRHHPRWAERAGDSREATTDSAALKSALVRKGHDDRHSPRHVARLDGGATRGDRTASIAGQTAYAEVPAADTQDEVAALEAIIAPEDPERESKTESNPARPEPVSWEAHATNMRAASATDAVHLRAQPGRNGKILTVVPEGASVKAEGNCADWCAVSYNGRKGWVYKDYVRFGQSTASRAKAPAATQAQKPLPAPTTAPTMFERTR